MSDENQDDLQHYLTVGELRRVIEKLPDSTPVYYQRIEDRYFETGWKTTKTPCDYFPNEYDEHVRAFTAFTRDGRLFLSAHF